MAEGTKIRSVLNKDGSGKSQKTIRSEAAYIREAVTCDGTQPLHTSPPIVSVQSSGDAKTSLDSGSSHPAVCGSTPETSSSLDKLPIFKLHTSFLVGISTKGEPPSNRRGHSAVKTGAFLFVFGGLNDDMVALNDTFLWHFETKTWSSPPIAASSKTAPKRRHGHSAVANGEIVYVFGGQVDQDGVLLNDLWGFSYGGATPGWFKVRATGALPNPRKNHSAVSLSNKLYIFGGVGAGEELFTDLLCCNLDTGVWRELSLGTRSPASTGPAPRRDALLVAYQSSLYLFGGRGVDGAVLSDWWEASSSALERVQTRVASAHSVGTSAGTVSGGEVDSMEGLDGAIGGVGSAGTEIVGSGGDDAGSVVSPLGSPTSLTFASSSGTLDGAPWTAVVPRNTLPPDVITHSMCGALMDENLFVLSPSPGPRPAPVLYQFNFNFRRWSAVSLAGGPQGDYETRAASTMVARKNALFTFGGYHLSSGLGNSRIDCLALSLDEEFDMMGDASSELARLQKEQWEAVAMRRHADVLQLRERVRHLCHQEGPSSPAVSSYATARASLSERGTLGTDTMLQLVMEHLEAAKCPRTLEAVQREAKQPLYAANKLGRKESRLTALLRVAQIRMRTVSDDLFLPDLPRPHDSDYDKVVEAVDRSGSLRETAVDSSGVSDVHVWDEGPDGRTNVMKQRTREGDVFIQAASLNKLIERLTPLPGEPIDLQFNKVFLLTYQSFTTPEIFFAKLLERYDVPEDSSKPLAEFLENVKLPIARRICGVLKLWFERCPGDFNSKLRFRIQKFIDGPLSRDGFLSLVKQTRLSMEKNLHRGSEADWSMFVDEPPAPKVPLKIFSTKISFVSLDDEEVARQFTLRDFETFVNVRSPELLSKAWEIPRLKHKTGNVRSLIDRFAETRRWVSSSILLPEKKKDRKAMVEKMVRIAMCLRTLQNYHTLFAFVEGIEWCIVQHKHLLSDVATASQQMYSQKLRKLMMNPHEKSSPYRSAVESSIPPAIPCISVILHDVAQISDTYPDKVAHLINFEKQRLLYDVIGQIQHWQGRPYHLQVVHQLLEIIVDMPVQSEEDLVAIARGRED